ncbi:hypothetical protein CMV_024386 [Castanea mollissima]|uniref:Uncharacterized protein n=1 Tax=Castanea mollissima TaxID=60419 RepID=A0A8J4V9P6_9ROSI|nr:hypothetical protein CMV_024386 [Castanea mollissima]
MADSKEFSTRNVLTSFPGTFYILVGGDPRNMKPIAVVTSPRPQAFEGVMVESLLIRDEGGWEKNLGSSSFLPHETEAILSIPISQTFPEDALTWAWTQNGRFTVSSAYKVACCWLLEQRRKADGGKVSNPNKRGEF